MKPIPIFILKQRSICRCCGQQALTVSPHFFSRVTADGKSRYRPLDAAQLPSLYEIVHIEHELRVDLCVCCLPEPRAYSNPTGPIDPQAAPDDPLSLPPLTIDEL